MQDLFKHKYLKYKQKYLNEKNMIQIGGDSDYTNPIIGKDIFPNVVNTKYVVNIDNMYFMLIYKSFLRRRDMILLKSSEENNFTDDDKYIYLVFYKSLSELGIFRLGCMIYGQYAKGDIHYVQQTFIDVRLQKYINANISKLPTEDSLSVPQVSYASDIYYHIQDTTRAIKIPEFFQYKSYCGKFTYSPDVVITEIQKTSNFIKENYTYTNNRFLYKYVRSVDKLNNINYSYNVNSIDLVPNGANDLSETLTLSYAIIDFCSHGNQSFTADHSPQIAQFQDNLNTFGKHCKYSDFFFPLFVSYKSTTISKYGTYNEYVLSSNFICKFMEYAEQCTREENSRSTCDTSNVRYTVVADRFIDIYPFNELANNNLMNYIINGQDINKFVEDGSINNMVNTINSNTGLSPLMYSVKYNNLTALKMLLNLGANMDYVNVFSGKSLLMYVQNDTNIEILELLIKHKADVNYINKISGKSILVYFLEDKNINNAFVESLVKNGSNVINGTDYVCNGKSPSIYAIKKSLSADLLQILIQNDNNVNKIYKYDTALMFAITNKNINAIKLLINNGADLNLVSENFVDHKFVPETPLMLAIRLNLTGSYTDVIKLLLEGKVGLYVIVDDKSPLMYAIHQKSSIEVINLLLQYNSNTNYVNSETSILNLLVTNYVYPKTNSNSSDYEGVDILKSLVKYGVDVNIKVKEESALSILYKARNYDSVSAVSMIQYLINSGATLTLDDIKDTKLNSINDVYTVVQNFPFLDKFIVELLHTLSLSEKLITSNHKEIISWLIYYRVQIKQFILTNIKENLYLFPNSLETIFVNSSDDRYIQLYRSRISVVIKN